MSYLFTISYSFMQPFLSCHQRCNSTHILALCFYTFEAFLFCFFAVDNTPPTVLNCPGNILRTVELGVTSLPVSWVEPSATDISGVVSLASRSHAPGDSFPIGPTVVSYVFLDSSSNDAPCAFTVTVTTGEYPLRIY